MCCRCQSAIVPVEHLITPSLIKVMLEIWQNQSSVCDHWVMHEDKSFVFQKAHKYMKREVDSCRPRGMIAFQWQMAQVAGSAMCISESRADAWRDVFYSRADYESSLTLFLGMHDEWWGVSVDIRWVSMQRIWWHETWSWNSGSKNQTEDAAWKCTCSKPKGKPGHALKKSEPPKWICRVTRAYRRPVSADVNKGTF